MPPSILNTMYSGYLRRCFTSAGLCSQTVNVDEETKMHFWGPTNQKAQKPSLVLIHGFGPAGMWQWREQVKILAPHSNLYVPDLIFFGASTSTSVERSETFQAASVGKLLDKLGVKKCDVLGTSYGGIVAYNLAKMLGEERVEKVIIASSGVNMTNTSNLDMLKRAQLENINDLMLPSKPQHLRKLMSLSIYKPPHLPDFLLSNILESLYSDNRNEKMELLRGLTIGRDGTSSIIPLQQEVLIVWGQQDQIFPVQLAHELKEVISKKVRLELINKAAHCPQMERPREFNKIVLNFLQDRS